MPHHPGLARRTRQAPASTFEARLGRLRRARADFLKLHIGDSDRGPDYELGYRPEFVREHPHAFQYANTWGVRRLREAIASKMRDENGLAIGADEVLVTAGATNALSVAVQTIVEPTEEVLVLTPAWPFFPGMVSLVGGCVREVPFYATSNLGSERAPIERIEEAVSPKTVALYLNSPNNPSGRVLDREELEVVLRIAARHDLWVISDEAYDGMLFDGRESPSPSTLADGLDRTISVFTFSKTYRFAGLRLGWACAPQKVLEAMNRVMVHQIYGPTVPGQSMMVSALQSRARWMPQLVTEYQRRRDSFLAALDLPVPTPEGTYFVFFEASRFLGSETVDDFVARCADSGVAVSPGSDFGVDYSDWIRLCFIAESPARAEEGARRIREML